MEISEATVSSSSPILKEEWKQCSCSRDDVCRFQTELLMTECNLLRVEKELAERRWLHVCVILLRSMREPPSHGMPLHRVRASFLYNVSLRGTRSSTANDGYPSIYNSVDGLLMQGLSLAENSLYEEDGLCKTASRRPSRESGDELAGHALSSLMPIFDSTMFVEPMEVEEEVQLKAIAAHVEAEMKQWYLQLQETHKEMQKAQEIWQNRALSAQAQLTTLQQGVEEWRVRAENAEEEVVLLRSEVEALSSEVEKVKHRHAMEQTRWLKQVQCHAPTMINNTSKTSNNSPTVTSSTRFSTGGDNIIQYHLFKEEEEEEEEGVVIKRRGSVWNSKLLAFLGNLDKKPRKNNNSSSNNKNNNNNNMIEKARPKSPNMQYPTREFLHASSKDTIESKKKYISSSKENIVVKKKNNNNDSCDDNDSVGALLFHADGDVTSKGNARASTQLAKLHSDRKSLSMRHSGTLSSSSSRFPLPLGEISSNHLNVLR